jgi:hypothetical protein
VIAVDPSCVWRDERVDRGDDPRRGGGRIRIRLLGQGERGGIATRELPGTRGWGGCHSDSRPADPGHARNVDHLPEAKRPVGGSIGIEYAAFLPGSGEGPCGQRLAALRLEGVGFGSSDWGGDRAGQRADGGGGSEQGRGAGGVAPCRDDRCAPLEAVGDGARFFNLAREREALAEMSQRVFRVGGSQQVAEVAQRDCETRLAGVLSVQRDALLDRPSCRLPLSGLVLGGAEVAECNRQFKG